MSMQSSSKSTTLLTMHRRMRLFRQCSRSWARTLSFLNSNHHHRPHNGGWEVRYILLQLRDRRHIRIKDSKLHLHIYEHLEIRQPMVELLILLISSSLPEVVAITQIIQVARIIQVVDGLFHICM